MPNNICNILTFSGNDDEITKLRDSIKNTDDSENEIYIDFEKIIPMPDELDIVEGSDTYNGMCAILEFIFVHLASFKANYPGLPIWMMFDRVKISEIVGINVSETEYQQGAQALCNILKYGHRTWYGWCIENWDTKWNAYNQESEDLHQIKFDTAWRPVLKIVQTLSAMFPDVEIRYEYADEDIGTNVSTLRYLNGTVNEKHIYKNGSREAYEAAAHIRGFELEEYLEDHDLVYDPEKNAYVNADNIKEAENAKN